MAAEPLYKQIADALRAEISAGQYSPDEQLPGAEALADRFDTSPATTREALKLLERERLIEIRRSVGAFIRQRKPIMRNANARLAKTQWGQGKAIWQMDLGDHYPVPETNVYTDDQEDAPSVPEFVRKALPADRYLIRDRRYVVDGMPVQIATSFFDYEVVKDTQIIRRDSGPGGVWNRLAEIGLEVKDPDELVTSRLPTEAEAKRLRITTDRPVSEIIRIAATAEGRVLEVNLMVLVGDAYVLQYQITT